MRKPPSLSDDDDESATEYLNLRIKQSLESRLLRISAITRKSKHRVGVRLLTFGVDAWEEDNRARIEEYAEHPPPPAPPRAPGKSKRGG